MTLLHGLHGKTIGGTKYSSPMPPFAQLSDATIAAIIDHERTSWGNAAPTIVPADVTRLR
jgi:cytochrome c oxidase cbb3-type subunit 2